MTAGRSLAVALVAAVTLAGCAGAPEPTGRPSEEFPAGEAGLGDPYFPDHGNPGYQVDHYDLAVSYDPPTRELTGSATVHATAAADLTALRMDLSGLAVATVTVDGERAEATRQEEKVAVTPASRVGAGDAFTVQIDYHGVPEPLTDPRLGSNGFHHTGDGAFAIGQPRSASTWFPVNDHPSDKATYDIEITVPEGLAAVSNGVPGEVTTADGRATWRWSEPSPMASYLAVLAIGDYRVHRARHGGLPTVVAVHSDLPTDVDEQLGRTGEIADTLAEWFGPYPFHAYGGIALADDRIRFALETQSRPVYGPGFFAGGRDATEIIVHELAHQWFGNSVSLSRWQDMWLNEGFATYAEWLWAEEDGEDTAAETFEQYWSGPGAEPGFWGLPPGDPGPDQLFDQAVYVRGAMTLHALRVAVGEDAFFEIVRAWADGNRHGHATTDDFVALSEKVAGESLAPLFDDWLYGTRRPDPPASW